MKFRHFIYLFIVTQLSIFSQELPPIEVFKPKDYGAEDQNWGISQSDDKTIYFANNKGLLTYNGARWKLYKSANSSIVRSVRVIEDKIYTGSYMDFGYWESNKLGILEYSSITKNEKVPLAEDEEFWNILELDRWILFQSLDRIYIYDTKLKTIDIIKSKTTITKIYKVNNEIYYQKIYEGIYKLKNDEEILITDNPLLKNNILINIFSINNELLFQTKELGFFIKQNGKFIKEWDSKLNTKLSNYSIYNSLQLKNGDFILGTVSNGIIYVNTKKEIEYTINQSNGLGNNTVLSLYEDKEENVWLGLDNGISNINFNAPFRVYKDDLGILGSVYTSFIDDDILYLGTNQGLFYKNKDQKGAFKFVKGTEGQVWSLQKIKNTLFCGHDKGSFIISKGKAERIYNTSGTWVFKEIDNNPDLIIQGNYEGLYILKKENDKWVLRNKIKGFEISSRHLEFIKQDEVLVSHEQKGVYKLKIDTGFNQVLSYSKTVVKKSIKSSLNTYNNKVLYGSNSGVFFYDTNSLDFKKDSILSNLYDFTSYISGKLINANNKLFAFTEQNITYVQREKLSAKYELFSIPVPNSVRETKDGYENILYIGDDKYLIGITSGYIITDLTYRNKINHTIKLDEVSAHSIKNEEKSLSLVKGGALENKENHIKISYSISNYSKYFPSLFRYRLLGSNNNWSDWSSKSEVYFENLPHGSYIFEASAKIGNLETNNKIKYNFTIAKPWYLKPLSLIIYFFSGVLILIIINILHRNYFKNQREKLLKKKEKELEIKQLENEQQLMHFKNLDLQKDIDSKNRELGLSTMNLIKRNELLGTIKKELGSTKDKDGITTVIKLINTNLNTSNDWKLFEEAFKNTDKGFMKKLKHKHSNLTSNDLRLCTYLRLNLSSKEIAPLLNISIRSVEVKRYRLRKKMNLPHEASLSSYILEI
jgi:DNA-binding CsgD family transcriptional regulator|tara:strand:- start:2080 stop:4875 length:2796 start_codon:yes stop_codon:yes gene_type:complete